MNNYDVRQIVVFLLRYSTGVYRFYYIFYGGIYILLYTLQGYIGSTIYSTGVYRFNYIFYRGIKGSTLYSTGVYRFNYIFYGGM